MNLVNKPTDFLVVLWSKISHIFTRQTLNINVGIAVAEASCPIYWIDANQTYLGCNKEFLTIFEINSSKDIIGKKTAHFIADPNIAETLSQNNHQAIHSNRLMIFEESLMSLSGKKITLLSHKKPILNTKGAVIGLFVISMDITKQIEVQEKLREVSENLSNSFENMIRHLPGHIWWLDKNNVFLGCNEAQAKFAGFTSQHQVVGKTNHDMPWKKHADILNEANNNVMETGMESIVEEKIQASDGTELFVLSKKAPYRDKAGEIIGTMGIAVDITDRKTMEKNLKIAMDNAEAANMAKTEFLEHVRHDVRTPLSGIIGLAELILCEPISEKVKNYSAQLKKSSCELLNFLNDMVESINIKSGLIPLMKKVFNLQSTLENVVELHRAKALDKNLILELVFDTEIPSNLIGDPVRIYRIILEMLGNSLKFTEKGHVKVIAKLLKKVRHDIVIQLEVEDSGPGVPLEKQQELFIRFKQTAPSYTGIYRGSGLGLSIVKQFMDDLKAEVGYADNPTGGARFICIIPFRQSLLDIPIEQLPQHSIISTS